MGLRDSSSLRIIVDLQACQTAGSYQRGVGNYAQGFFENLVDKFSHGEVFSLTSPHLPHEVDCSAVAPDRRMELGMDLDWQMQRDFLGGNLDSLGSIAHSAKCQSVKPDIIHVSHSFMDIGDRAVSPGTAKSIPGQITSTTLFDLIPLVFSDHYLQDETTYRRYTYQLEQLRRYDLLFAISESTRRDAIELLGIEPWKVVTIHGGVSPIFEQTVNRAHSLKRIARRFKVKDKILLYTGGDDYRKNIDGLIRGFAATSSDIRTATTLVIVAKISPQSLSRYQGLAVKLGLNAGDILFTGFIPDDDLVALYQACDAFIFPSKYEGLGLPVLEAMNCGAPVIGANNSSISELISRSDALFDAEDPQSISSLIEKVLTNESFAGDLREHGLKRCKDFSWERSTKIAKTAFDEALERSRKTGFNSARAGWIPRQRIAILTPLPPCQSGIADYAADFLPYLSRHFDIDIYLDGYRNEALHLSSIFRIFDVKHFRSCAQNYAAVVYEVGNSDFHTHMLDLLEDIPGIVSLHDAYMSGIFAHLEFGLSQQYRFESEMLYSHGPRARSFLLDHQNNAKSIDEAVKNLPLTKGILDKAIGVFSHSAFNLKIARENYPEGWLAPYRIIPQMMAGKAQANKKANPEYMRALREKLELPVDAFIISTFGHVASTKCGDKLLKSFLSSKLLLDSNTYLVFVGKLAQGKFSNHLKRLIKSSALGKRIRITGFVTSATYRDYLGVSDLAVQLRQQSRGGTPRSVLDCLASGVPTIVNNSASFLDYPADVVVKTPARISIPALTKKLEGLFRDKDLRQTFSDAGKKYVMRTHNPADCAAAYAAAIHEFIAREEATKEDFYLEQLLPHVSYDEVGLWAKKLFNGVSPKVFQRRRCLLLLDLSKYKSQSGETKKIIQKFIGTLYRESRAGIEPKLIHYHEDGFVSANKWLAENGLISISEQIDLSDSNIDFLKGDILLHLDQGSDHPSPAIAVLDDLRAKRVSLVAVINNSIIANISDKQLLKISEKYDAMLFDSKQVMATATKLMATAGIEKPPATYLEPDVAKLTSVLLDEFNY